MKKKPLYIAILGIFTLVVILCVFSYEHGLVSEVMVVPSKESNFVERYGVIQTSSTSGELRLSYYDMERGETLDSWQVHPWFFATPENIEDSESVIGLYDYVQSNKDSVFKIVGKKDADDCGYYGNGVCLESIIVDQIEAVREVDIVANMDNQGDNPAKEENADSNITLSEEQLKSYYAVYSDPFVIHIRKALNGYLDGTNEGMEIPEAAIVGHDMESGSRAGLESFEKDYYQSKFVVMALEDALMGGKTATIIFQDRPDRVFTAWVYKLGEDQYDLRGFWEDAKATENIDEQIRILGKYLLDAEHSL